MTSDTIMIAYDGSQNAERAIGYAARFLRAKRTYVVTAWESGSHQAARLSSLAGGMQPAMSSEYDVAVDDELRIEAAEINNRGVHQAHDAGMTAEGRLVEVSTTVWSALVDMADELDVDLLVTGTRGASGFKALLHSSTAEAVLKHCHRPVFIVPACCTGTSAAAPDLHSSAQPQA
ncbi:universal stress protein [Jongsikchunia kroppenstedtii]|uniref:universal stress protein n=1 Tax=Jongsikchunia kroppenstedtii TaxID=1121721 RepID=UPI000379E7FF|nr:universal stress protein [Jongsikchunia kroppenstedtii]